MFLSPTAQEVLSTPEKYSEEKYYKQEQATLFNEAWSFAGLKSELLKAGELCTIRADGSAIITRNIEGTLKSNLTCNYTKKILKTIIIGDIILVKPSKDLDDQETIEESLTKELNPIFDESILYEKESLSIKANWKVIIENAIEGYHVPTVHSDTFKTYYDEAFCDHKFTTLSSSYRDTRPWENGAQETIYSYLTQSLLNQKPKRFTLTHVFPYYLFFYGDLVRACSIVEPTSAETSNLHLIFYFPKKFQETFKRRIISFFLKRFLKNRLVKIQNEDCRIFNEIQWGVKNSNAKCVLSRREERIFHFQNYLKKVILTSTHANEAPFSPK